MTGSKSETLGRVQECPGYEEDTDGEKITIPLTSLMDQMAKNCPMAMQEPQETRFDPWFGRSPGGRYGNSFQYSCLENTWERGAWRAAVHGTAKSWTWLKWLSMHSPLLNWKMIALQYCVGFCHTSARTSHRLYIWSLPLKTPPTSHLFPPL